jgi:hypothetical protein
MIIFALRCAFYDSASIILANVFYSKLLTFTCV